MAKAVAEDPDAYVAALPLERQEQVQRLRKLAKKAVPKATEGIVWGMLGFQVNGRPFAGIASHKSYLSLHLMDIYTQPDLRKKHEKALAKLKMGKSCINFSVLDSLPLETIEAILREAPRITVTTGTLAAQSKPAATKAPGKKKR